MGDHRDHADRDPLAHLARHVDALIEMLDRRFTSLDCTLATVIAQGVTLMAQNKQILDFLTLLDTYTTQLAIAQADQTAKIVEIAADIDRLIAEGTLDPAVESRLQAAAASLASTVAFEDAQARTLTAIASKSDEPLPPPADVIPPPSTPAPPIGGGGGN